MKNILFLVFISIFLTACAQTTQTGRSQIMLMSESEEVSLGAKSAKEILQNSKISNDSKATIQIRRVGANIAKAANKPEYEWEFYLLEDKSKNAFCLPGGKIFVYTGLMSIIANDDELATVMGHEVAHALLHHSAERMSINKVQNTLGTVLSVAMNIFAPGYAGLANTAYSVGSTYAVALPYSRSHELEADKVGIELMINAGYDPKYALNFWQKMNAEGGSGIEFFSTHPSDKNRIKQIQELISK